MNAKQSAVTTGALLLAAAMAAPAVAEGFRDLHDNALEPTYRTYDIDAAWPDFAVDHRWPKPLPNQWILGETGGIAVDRHDHIWLLQRPRTLTDREAGATEAYVDPNTGEVATNEEGEPIDALGNPRPFGPRLECCLPAPSVLVFDKEGNLLKAWGGPADEGYLGSNKCREENGCVWPAGEHGIYVDHNDYVYIGGNGNGTGGTPWAATHGWDAHFMKFSADGTHLLTIGLPGNDQDTSNDTDGGLNGTPILWRPADSELDPKTNELYIADGYGNHRVVVVDADTGLYKRHWGAYGQNPVDIAAATAQGPYAEDRDAGITPQHFRNPVHCVRITHDRKVYVCDRLNNRLQVFKPDGTFIEEKFIRSESILNGTVYDLDTSSDRAQSCLYNVDGGNEYSDTLHRKTLELLATFGRHGRYAGQFHAVHSVVTDSDGNLYTGEVNTGRRVQKFVRSGVEGCWLK